VEQCCRKDDQEEAYRKDLAIASVSWEAQREMRALLCATYKGQPYDGLDAGHDGIAWSGTGEREL
jgi:hypothetical protein